MLGIPFCASQTIQSHFFGRETETEIIRHYLEIICHGFPESEN